MRAILLCLVSALSYQYVLVMLVLGWPTRGILVLSLFLFALVAVKRHEKHHRSEIFDDRLTTERQLASIEWLIFKRLERGDINVED